MLCPVNNRVCALRAAGGMLPAIAALLLAMAAPASEWYVSTNGTGAGTNWATAFTSIQVALNTATGGDFIYVKAGTYSVTTQLVWTNSGVTILGAYKGTNAAGPGDFNVTNWPTVLRRPTGSASTNRIMFVKGVNGGTLGRVTLSNGWLNTASAITGGCLCVIGSSGLTFSSLTVAGGKIALNSPLAKGGGVFIADSINVTIADSTIRDNNVDAGNNNVADGCGIYARNTILTITNCSIRNNFGGYSTRGAGGAGGYFKDCRATVVDTAIHGNYSAAGIYQWHSGGGIYVSGGTNLFRNCLIAGNDNLYHGGSPGRGWSHGDGAYLYSGVSTFVNCTVVMNNGEGIYYNAGSVAVTNCILWDNLDDLVNFPTNAAGVLTGVWYCNVENGDNAGTNGCISSDPLFERGLYLATNSPCVNAGSSPAGTAGLAGRTTRADGIPDSNTVDLGYHFAGGILGGPRDKLYVSPSGTDTNTGTGWSTAFRSITRALSVAGHGTRINIATGLYSSACETFPLTISGLFGVELLGTNAAATLIKPTGSGKRGFNIKAVGFLRIHGLSITGANPSTYTPGSAAYIGNSRLTVSSCSISSNGCWPVDGGAIWMKDTFLTMTNSTLAANTASSDWASYGGGIYAQGGQLTLVDSSVLNNRATPGGGGIAGGAGIYLNGNYGGDTHSIRNCVFKGNTLTCPGVNLGAGLYLAATTSVRNCVFVSNGMSQGTKLGSAIFIGAGYATIENCTIVNNSPEGVRQNTTGDALEIRNSILWGNGNDLFSSNMVVTLANVSHCDIEDGDNNGTNGCFSADPLFEYGLYLSASSPCVNTGDVTAAAAGLSNRTTRADGVFDSGTVDLGYHLTNGILGASFAELYVAPWGLDTRAGTNWPTAFRSITKALLVSRDGTRVHISTGLYNTACETFPLTIDKLGLELLGTNAAATLIRPTGSGKRGFYINGVDSVRIQGVTLADANPATYTTGAGAYIINSRLEMSSCVISNNSCWPINGGGIWMNNAFLTMTNCTLVKNTSSSDWGNYGGGIYAEGGQLVLLDSFVLNNSASPSAGGTAGGGGIYLGGTCGAAHMIRNCVFTGNRLTSPANNHGAALYLATTTSIRNCLFAFNGMSRGAKLGSAVFVGAGHTTLENCTVVSNSPEGIRQNTAGNALEIRNSILWSNSDDIASADIVSTLANLWYSDIEDGDNSGVNGCISADPLFANPASDWHLRSHGGRWTPGDIWVKDIENSPCIDAGDPASDHSKEPPVNGGRINMGAYGNTSQASKPFARGTVCVVM